jgi:signal transduction histidine kinase
MFITGTDGQLIASLPAIAPSSDPPFSANLWREGAMGSPDIYVSPVHPRSPDGRMATAIVGAVRTADGNVAGYLGVWVLVERMGRRLSTIDFADQAICQIVDQTGAPLFTNNFAPNTGPAPPHISKIIGDIRALKTGSIERDGNLYSFTTVDSTGWITYVEQPKAVAYKPVRDLLDKITIPALWLIVVTAVAAWLAGRVARRQAEAARRIEREVIFNEKILANMPSGIALIDPESRHFLQANQAFVDMAKRFGELPEGRDIYEAIYDEVKIAPGEAIERVLAFGAPYQLVEHGFTDREGMTRFVNVNLLRLQTSEETIQGVLYLVEDKTRDMTLRQELIGANAAKDQFLALLSHELRNPLSPVIAMVGELEASAGDSPEVRRALEVIRRNVELEARLIDDLLDVTRISKGKLQLSLETASVHEILQRSYEICRERFEDRIPVARRTGLRRRRSGAVAAGVLEPRQKQREVHAGQGPDRDSDVESHTRHRGNPHDRYRDRDRNRPDGADLQRVRARPKLDHPALRRPRARSCDFQGDGQRARRNDQSGKQREESRRYFHRDSDDRCDASGRSRGS